MTVGQFEQQIKHVFDFFLRVSHRGGTNRTDVRTNTCSNTQFERRSATRKVTHMAIYAPNTRTMQLRRARLRRTVVIAVVIAAAAVFAPKAFATDANSTPIQLGHVHRCRRRHAMERRGEPDTRGQGRSRHHGANPRRQRDGRESAAVGGADPTSAGRRVGGGARPTSAGGVRHFVADLLAGSDGVRAAKGALAVA